MSGIEIAGLALGALPIIISALESYNDGLDPLKSFVRWERELPQFIRKLRNQHVHFAQTMRQLLEPITSEFELAEMLSEPSGRLWKDPATAEKLKDKLNESFQAYQSTISDIERIMKKIASKLDIDRAADMTRNDLEAILAANPSKGNNKFEFRKRVRFGMSKKTIKALLEELDECNKELERFTDKSEKLDTYRKAAKPSFTTGLQRIQTLAKSLHTSILSSWSCSCRSYHKTSLQLEQRGSLYVSGPKKPKVTKKTCFLVSFSSSGDGAHPWTRQEAEISIDEDEWEESLVVPAMKPKITKSVSFGESPPPPYSAKPEAAASLTHTMAEVKDLCASIQQLHKSSSCIGFSLDTHSRLRGVYPVEGTIEQGKGAYEAVTLDKLLNQPPTVNGRPVKLSKKERYSLAVTLASSALQLNATPWFPDLWSAKDIYFHQTPTGPRLIDVDHPYVASKLEAMSNGPAQKSRGFHNKNTILLALAVALLELYFGMSAEEHQEKEKAPADGSFDANPWTLCATAYEWAQTENENLSAAFLSAVTHCLQCFTNPTASLQDSDFLQAAVESIVLPLQDELHQFLGKPGS